MGRRLSIGYEYRVSYGWQSNTGSYRKRHLGCLLFLMLLQARHIGQPSFLVPLELARAEQSIIPCRSFSPPAGWESFCSDPETQHEGEPCRGCTDINRRRSCIVTMTNGETTGPPCTTILLYRTLEAFFR
mmetsp:Transcript_18296/g.42348  ORF Transcript_18296/g.42348 Transcript_18296/m.42348 type:complete len:130 (-) Transcript_18296:279-668(-)